MKKAILCGHTGSNNHGCEAIIKGTAEILDGYNINCALATKAKEQDEKFGLSEFCDVYTYKNVTGVKRFISRIVNKLVSPRICSEYFHQRNVWKELKNNIAINVGGDTYCYDIPWTSIHLNRFTSKKNIPCILFGCSIEDTAITDFIKKDLHKFDLIMPRESLTYQNLIDAGIEKEKLYEMTDPAFVLPKQEYKLDAQFFEKPVVGINLSPLVISECEKEGMVMQNYRKMVEHIFESTDYNICLVPHVYSNEVKQDLIPLTEIYNEYKDTDRIMLIDEEINCKQLKYVISKCSLFVCARTHASIAAYSSCVPTLVIGYSVKSKGIALDLFGAYENYVIPTQELSFENQLKDGFVWLDDNKDNIRKKLTDCIEDYKQKAYDAGKAINAFIK